MTKSPANVRIPASTPAGLYTHAGDADWVGTAASTNRQLVRIDTRMRWDKAAFLAACADAFAFPDWFGRNWDALADSLSDVVTDSGSGLLVVWRGWGGMARMSGPDFTTACDILAEFTARQQGFDTSVIVVLAGPGPQTGFPALAGLSP
jgi:RNAse (barnase) inhibitor barstar